jgi:hypothetical protein
VTEQVQIPEPILADHELFDVVLNSWYAVLVRDHPRVAPDSRGRWYRIFLKEAQPSFGMPRGMTAMVTGWTREAKSTPGEGNDNMVVMAFHGWLIERLVKVATTKVDVEARIEHWHDSQKPPLAQLTHTLGWTWDEYAEYTEKGNFPVISDGGVVDMSVPEEEVQQ